MAAEAGVDVHHFAPRCLLRLFDVAAGGLADWSEFDAEVERWGIEVRGISREDLTVRIESSIFEIPTTEHRRLHQEASDFVRWGRRGSRRTVALYGRPHISLLARLRWTRRQVPRGLILHRVRPPAPKPMFSPRSAWIPIARGELRLRRRNRAARINPRPAELGSASG
jgi:hypothetical protein